MMQTTEAVKAFHISLRQLDYWIRRGWIQCEDQKPGSGTKRVITYHGCAVLERMAILVTFGLDPEKAHSIADELVKCNTSFIARGPVGIQILVKETDRYQNERLGEWG